MKYLITSSAESKILDVQALTILQRLDTLPFLSDIYNTTPNPIARPKILKIFHLNSVIQNKELSVLILLYR